jgi:pimeloyl-ACP methyl ester carboxylesterase
VILRDGAELYVRRWPRTQGPAVVLVHGYPDTHSCWDELGDRLAERFHVVAYDVRGMGRSRAPDRPGAFRLPELAHDLDAVLDHADPDRPVHLVGHDWGAFQAWQAVLTPGIGERVASFTSIAGPRLDASQKWVRRRRRPDAKALRQLAEQARRSWYIAALQVPVVPERLLRSRFDRVWPRVMARVEGIEPRPGHPAATLGEDAATGAELYRQNLLPLRDRWPWQPAGVPVQLIVPTRDRYISVGIYDECADWATQLWRREIDTGHWAQRTHPELVARWAGELIDHVEGGPEAPDLAAARVSGGA